MSAQPGGGAAQAGAGATASIRTIVGELVYLASMKAKVEPILTIIANDFEKTVTQGMTLNTDIPKLEKLETEYKDFKVEDVKSEVDKNTDKGLKDDASRVRDNDRNTKGFMIVVNKLIRDLPRAEKEVQLALNDQKINEIGKEVAKLKKAQEDLKGWLDLGTDIIHAATDITNPIGWVDLAKDLGKAIIDNQFENQIGPLEEQAGKLTDSKIAEHLKMAQDILRESKTDFQSWQAFLATAAHDLQSEVEERDTDYDTQNDHKKKGTVRFTQLKDGVALANTTHDLLNDTIGTAHSLTKLLDQLEAGNTSSWIGDPATTHGTIAAMKKTVTEQYKALEPKVNWSKKLGVRFQSFYEAGGSAMADKKV